MGLSILLKKGTTWAITLLNVVDVVVHNPSHHIHVLHAMRKCVKCLQYAVHAVHATG